MENTQFSQMFQDPIQSTIKEARQIADMIKSQRLQARTQPAVSALSDITRQWQSAQDDEQRQRLNALASLTRANYLAGGGSPADLPKQYWGSDPTQGFQTTAGFEAPITGLEGLKRQDAISNKLKFLQDAFEKQKWEASPESDPRYKGLYLTKLQRDAYAPYSTGGSGYTTGQQMDDLFKVWQLTGKAPKGLEGLGITPGTPLSDTDDVTNEYMAQILTYKTRDEALKEFEKYKTVMERKGADINAIRQEIDRVFPPATGGGGYNEDYVNRWLNYTPF